jgi:AraC-like DNA-binding protein
MAMTPRTLQRHLADRNLKFQPLLNELRGRLADEYLSDLRLQLSEIALLLGYSEQSAFNRAYKQWSGLTPRQARLKKTWGVHLIRHYTINA